MVATRDLAKLYQCKNGTKAINLAVKRHINRFPDRHFIIDRKIIYHCGTSINHIGSKTFSINRLEDEVIIDLLIKRVEKIINKKII